MGRGEGSPALEGTTFEVRSAGVFEFGADVGVCEGGAAGADGVVEGTGGEIGGVADIIGRGFWLGMWYCEGAG